MVLTSTLSPSLLRQAPSRDEDTVGYHRHICTVCVLSCFTFQTTSKPTEAAGVSAAGSRLATEPNHSASAFPSFAALVLAVHCHRSAQPRVTRSRDKRHATGKKWPSFVVCVGRPLFLKQVFVTRFIASEDEAVSGALRPFKWPYCLHIFYHPKKKFGIKQLPFK